jgi:hypothetical protein
MLVPMRIVCVTARFRLSRNSRTEPPRSLDQGGSDRQGRNERRMTTCNQRYAAKHLRAVATAVNTAPWRRPASRARVRAADKVNAAYLSLDPGRRLAKTSP